MIAGQTKNQSSVSILGWVACGIVTDCWSDFGLA